MSLASLIKGRRGPSGFGYASTAEEVTGGLNLEGRTFLVTGVGSGLGQETARVLLLRGARVVGLARTKDAAARAMQGLGGVHDAVACDLSEPASVRAAVASVKALGIPLDALILNAGVMALQERTLKHGQELQFLTNHIGHFMLATGLIDQLTSNGRVVAVSSEAHRRAPPVGIQFDDLTFERGYNPWSAYGQSKLANILFARRLSKQLAGTGRTANALHPGVIATNLGRHMPLSMKLLFPIASVVFLKSIPEGAATQCFVATHPSLERVSGEYFSDCNVASPTTHGRDDVMAERLWSVTEEIVARLP